MSFTAPITDDFLPDLINTVMTELTEAYSQRFAALRHGPLPINGTSNLVSADALTLINNARGVLNSLYNGEPAQFARLDNDEAYTTNQEILTEAGYPDGWISLTDLPLSASASVWIQIHDVLAVLTNMRREVEAVGVESTRYYQYATSLEAAWDGARLGGGENNYDFYGYAFWSQSTRYFAAQYVTELAEGGGVLFDTDYDEDFDGDLVRFIGWYRTEGRGDTYPLEATIDFEAFGIADTTTSAVHVTTTDVVIDNPPLLFGTTNFAGSLAITTAVPADCPFGQSLSSLDIAAIYLNISMTAHFMFDLTPVLTYG